MLRKEVIRTYECDECHKKVLGETTWDDKERLPEKWISIECHLSGPFADRKKYADTELTTFRVDFCCKACAVKKMAEILERELAN